MGGGRRRRLGMRRRCEAAPRPAGGAGRNQNAALSPLLAVTSVPLVLAGLIARGVVALGDSFAVPGGEPA
jgi:hypothetical protein